MGSAEALVFDAIRTPRGKGKSNGSLHEIKPVDLVVGLIDEMLRPQPDARPQPDRRRRARLRLAGRRPGRRHRQDRRAHGRPARTPSPASSSTASAPPASRPSTSPRRRSRSGWEDLVLAGGVESMSRVPMGSDGGAWAMDPETELRHRLRPAGHRRRPDRHDRGLQPRRRRRVRRRVAGARRRRRGPTAASPTSVVPVKDLNGTSCSTTTSSSAPARPSRRSAGLKPSFADDRRDGRLRRRGAAEVPLGRADRPRPHAGNSSGIVDGAALVAIGTEQIGADARPDAAGPDRRHRGLRRRPDDHADRPRAGRPQGAGQGRPDGRRHRPVRDQRGLRRRRAAVRARHGPRHGEGQRQRRRDRDGPPARRDRRDDPRHADRRARAHATCATAWPRSASAAAWASRPSSRRSEHGREHDHPLGAATPTASSSSPSTTPTSRRTR